MLASISENISTIIVGAIVALWLVIAVVKIISDKRNGKCSCGDCPHRGACHMTGEKCKNSDLTKKE